MISEMGAIADAMLRSPALRSWFPTVVDFAKSGFPRIYPVDDYSAVHVDRQIRSNCRAAGRALSAGRSIVGGRHRPALQAQEVRALGNYPYVWDRWFDHCDIAALLHAYLQLLKREGAVTRTGELAKTFVLERSKADGTPVFDRPDQQAKLLFDPRGGVYTRDFIFRRSYLMWRCALVMSLYDVAEKSKLVFCREYRERILPTGRYGRAGRGVRQHQGKHRNP
jgi:hypothetical protein